ncbi:hypothetical protein [Pseudonocardia sp. N23]|uniref:hypothetical protein n=1 Tax=Pseudonocardia sp. N23 TaxID=1987376 RepID=UPI000BFC4448|nr:hypothetical protein [Pseudonocardia sp. N23]GAY09038.1 hypothetical protein TOK_2994 [Pseudonocardia sp. N23]
MNGRFAAGRFGAGRCGAGRFGLGLVVAALALTACSQAAALAPVGGSREALVRFAGNDVLVSSGVAIRTAPVCITGADGVVCTGAAVGGDPIRMTGTPTDPLVLVVTVGGRTLHDGPAQDVVDSAARPS